MSIYQINSFCGVSWPGYTWDDTEEGTSFAHEPKANLPQEVKVLAFEGAAWLFPLAQQVSIPRSKHIFFIFF